MACTISFIPTLITGLADLADAVYTWTYNGFILITGSANPYDGDADNLTQFITSADTPANPPEEFPTKGNSFPTENPEVDFTGHTAGYYSLSLTIRDSTLSCSTTNNIVLPLVEGPNPGVSVEGYPVCTTEDNIINVFDLISIGGTNGTRDDGSWTQVGGTPNPHPGFYDGGTDPTLATFDWSQVNYPHDSGPFIFEYESAVDIPTGFKFPKVACSNCLSETSTVTFSQSNTGYCCGNPFCYRYFMTYSTTSENLVAMRVYNWPDVITFATDPYFTQGNYDVETQMATFVDDLNNWFANHNGGVATYTDTGTTMLVYVQDACYHPTFIFYREDLSAAYNGGPIGTTCP